MTDLNEMARAIHDDAVERGFYDEPQQAGTLLMLVVSELAEALEADRTGRHATSADLKAVHDAWAQNGGMQGAKDTFQERIKDTFEDEIADAIIRLFDLCGHLGIDIKHHIYFKLEYNKTRGYKHGKKY